MIIVGVLLLILGCLFEYFHDHLIVKIIKTSTGYGVGYHNQFKFLRIFLSILSSICFILSTVFLLNLN
jgi:predicted membrane protein